MKFTKIIATIGPSCDTVQKLKGMHKAGMDVARMNFSHASHSYATKVISNIRKVSKNIGIMLDTKGPEIRTGKVKGDSIQLKKGQKLLITNKKQICIGKKLTINYKNLMKLKKGQRILLDDGLIEIVIDKKIKDGFSTVVKNNAILSSNKSVTIPGHKIDIPFLSKKDREDILFGKDKVDFIAASFVRRKGDIRQIRRIVGPEVMIIAKIEHWESIENIDELIDEADGVMIARGDLGVELSLEKVPKIQAETIRKCNEKGVPVIVATQMLESMKNNPRPTRAEVSDVANAIMQGTDAVMLSAETTIGMHPIEAVRMMSKIAKEHDLIVNVKIKPKTENSVALFITEAAYLASKELGIKAILIPTESGFTARNVSRFKPKVPIYAMTPSKRLFRQLHLSWGVVPVCVSKDHEKLDSVISQLVESCHHKGLLKKRDRIVVTGGYKLKQAGGSNIIEISAAEEILFRS